MHSVGTTGQIIEIFTYLLKHLKSSVEKVSTLQGQLISKKPAAAAGNMSSSSMGSLQQMANSAGCADTAAKISKDLVEEQHLQRKIIDAMGQFTANLPDYSKNDVVMFIARQINSQQFTYLDAAIANQQQQVLVLLKTELVLFLKATKLSFRFFLVVFGSYACMCALCTGI